MKLIKIAFLISFLAPPPPSSLWYWAEAAATEETAGTGPPVCGADTYLADDGDVCLCDTEVACSNGDDLATVNLAGIFDLESFDWGPFLFQFVVDLINDHSDGFHDDVFDDGTRVEYTISDSACDANQAARAYWNVRGGQQQQQNGSRMSSSSSSLPPHGVVGCRCSGASISVAQLTGLDGVCQVSPSSTSTELSDMENYPLFFRTVAPDDERGQVGALVSALRLFGWDRVVLIATETAYARDFSSAFEEVWTKDTGSGAGTIAHSDFIPIDANGDVPRDSVVRVLLDDIPASDSPDNSRVILLIAHEQHAYPILEIAHEIGFQKDAVWFGTQAWGGRPPPDQTKLPQVPGYFGVSPRSSKQEDNKVYKDFLQRIQAAQKEAGMEPWEQFPDYAAEQMVDSIVAICKALSDTPPENRRDGNIVAKMFHRLQFEGISGPVRFTSEGDRQDPQFVLLNLKQVEEEGGGALKWVPVGQVGTTIDSADFFSVSNFESLCFAEVGCVGLEDIPEGVRPVPRTLWPYIVLPLFGAILLYFSYRRCKDGKEKEDLKKKINEQLYSLGDQVEAARKKQEALILQRGQLDGIPDNWEPNTDSTLVEVEASKAEYWDVAERLKATMEDAHISKLWRVQNLPLWSYYSFHKDRLAMNGIDANETKVFHGTSSTDPGIIYNDRADGFMMQYSRDGFWGRGIYFAEKSSYSDSYAYRLHDSWSPFVGSQAGERPNPANGEREMFLARLLVGSDIYMDRDQSEMMRQRCHALTVPPENLATKLRYNTVTGTTGGSKVYIVYENGRAFPEYLIRYYRGGRDHKRTPFEDRKSATGTDRSSSNSPTTPTTSISELSNNNDDAAAAITTIAAPSAMMMPTTWEFLDDTGWRPYGANHQQEIENVFQAYSKSTPTVGSSGGSSKLVIQTDAWKYEVDVKNMKQKNLTHPNRRERDIQRLVGSNIV